VETLYIAKERELIGEISSLFLSVELYSYFSWEVCSFGVWNRFISVLTIVFMILGATMFLHLYFFIKRKVNDKVDNHLSPVRKTLLSVCFFDMGVLNSLFM